MKFELRTSQIYYRQRDLAKFKSLGFEFSPCDNCFIIEGYPEVEIETLEDLLYFIEKNGVCVVGQNFEGEPVLEIYNDYRE